MADRGGDRSVVNAGQPGRGRQIPVHRVPLRVAVDSQAAVWPLSGARLDTGCARGLRASCRREFSLLSCAVANTTAYIVGQRSVPAAARCRIGGDHPLPDPLGDGLRLGKQRRLVDGQDLAVAHHELAVDHHRLDDAGMAVVHDVRHQPDDRPHRRSVQVEDGQVGLHARPRCAPISVGRRRCGRALHGDHVEHLLRRSG